jgi:hypothetical protein
MTRLVAEPSRVIRDVWYVRSYSGHGRRLVATIRWAPARKEYRVNVRRRPRLTVQLFSEAMAAARQQVRMHPQ